MVAYKEAVLFGALISYGLSSTKIYGRVAYYVDEILKGARPADLPIELPTLFELFINAKTAKTLGITIPPTLLSRRRGVRIGVLFAAAHSLLLDITISR